MYSDQERNIWAELNNGMQIDIYRRNLQKYYVNSLISIVKPSMPMSSSSASDATSIARGQLVELRQSLRNAAASSSGVKRYHLQDMIALIDTALDTSNK